METSAPTNSTTDYSPSYKERPLCRTEVINEEVGEKRVKASPVNIKFTSEEDCFLKKGIENILKGHGVLRHATTFQTKIAVEIL